MWNRESARQQGNGFDNPRAYRIDGGAFREFDVDVAHIERAAVQRLNGRELNLSRSAVGLALGDAVTMRQSAAGVVVARSVAADEVHAGILLAPVVRGEVHTWIDLRTAIALGFGMGLAKVMVSGLKAAGRRIF